MQYDLRQDEEHYYQGKETHHETLLDHTASKWPPQVNVDEGVVWKVA